MADTWYAVIDGGGNLISTGTVLADPAVLSAAGYSSITLTSDPSGKLWDPATRTFSDHPKPPTVLSTWDWIRRFTPAEFGAIQASTDAQVRMFMLMVQTATTITPSDPIVQGGLGYLAAIGLITPDRPAVIGAS